MTGAEGCVTTNETAGLEPEIGGTQRLWAIRLGLIGAIKLYPPLPSGSIGVPQRLRHTTGVEGIFSPARVWLSTTCVEGIWKVPRNEEPPAIRRVGIRRGRIISKITLPESPKKKQGHKNSRAGITGALGYLPSSQNAFSAWRMLDAAFAGKGRASCGGGVGSGLGVGWGAALSTSSLREGGRSTPRESSRGERTGGSPFLDT